MTAGSTPFTRPEILIETGWLADHLDDPGIRVFDCTTHLLPSRTAVYEVKSGLEDYLAGHIPGAGFLDLQGHLSDPDSRFRFTMPAPSVLAGSLGALGLGDGHRAVLYSSTSPIWATRVWWMLRAIGFDNAGVLNGGLTKWKREGRPVATGESAYPPARLTPRPRDGLFVGKEAVLAGIGDAGSCVLNALTAEQHDGSGGRHYGRPGRISGSVNVPTAELLDPETTAFIPAGEIAARFAGVGADKDRRIIPYCGGGIAASATCFLLTALGHDNVALYDNSLSEWVRDPALPMETGPAA